MNEEVAALETEAAVDEAIRTLGYVLPSALEDFATILPLCFRYGPKAVATKYRKHGEQITDDEKKAMGLRRNAFYSKRAMSLLTPKGFTNPIDGIVNTLSRAGHTLNRSRAISAASTVEDARIRMNGHDKACAGCVRSNLQVVDADQLSPFPPEDCQRENCYLLFSVDIDFLARLRR